VRVMIRTYLFPGVLRGLPGPRLATTLEPIYCGPLTPLHRARKLLGHPFFRRYGVNLPSSLTEGHSFTLGEFPLPTGVGLRYGQSFIWLEAFLGGLGGGDFRPLA